jgi:2-keto-4-pentenoate hydratase/2-oxohepta-3-ene-1,7-dioic acid hydratase in catechol pathway
VPSAFRELEEYRGNAPRAAAGSGLWLMTADRSPYPSKLTLQTRLNGTVVQNTIAFFFRRHETP